MGLALGAVAVKPAAAQSTIFNIPTHRHGRPEAWVL